MWSVSKTENGDTCINIKCIYTFKKNVEVMQLYDIRMVYVEYLYLSEKLMAKWKQT